MGYDSGHEIRRLVRVPDSEARSALQRLLDSGTTIARRVGNPHASYGDRTAAQTWASHAQAELGRLFASTELVSAFFPSTLAAVAKMPFVEVPDAVKRVQQGRNQFELLPEAERNKAIASVTYQCRYIRNLVDALSDTISWDVRLNELIDLGQDILTSLQENERGGGALAVYAIWVPRVCDNLGHFYKDSELVKHFVSDDTAGLSQIEVWTDQPLSDPDYEVLINQVKHQLAVLGELRLGRSASSDNHSASDDLEQPSAAARSAHQPHASESAQEDNAHDLGAGGLDLVGVDGREQLLLEVSTFHSRVADPIRDLAQAGLHKDALRKALIGLEERIRDLLGDSDKIGADLASAALSGANPTLDVSLHAGKSGDNERDGFHSIFRGVFIGIRNITAHVSDPKIEDVETFEVLALLSMLHRRLDVAESRLRTRNAR